MATIGDRIKQKRLEMGYTVDDVAKLLGKNRATVYRYESNEIENFPTTVLEPLSKILNTTPAHLMGWEKIDEDLDFSTRIASTYFNSLMSWTEDKLFKKYETTVIRGHMAELFLRYKKIIEQLVYAQREWDKSKESFSKFYKEKPNPLTDREIKEIFLRQQLEESLNSLSSWVQNLPSWTTREELKYVEGNETANTLVKEKSKIIGIPKKEDTPDHLILNAAHEIEGASDEDKQHDEDIMNDENF